MARPKRFSWFHGIDQAKSPDFMTVYVHGLEKPKPRFGGWLPKLRDVFRFHHDNYENVFRWYADTVCKLYHPTRVVIDTTNNVMMGDSISNRFGKKTVDARMFQNVGQSNTKYELKQIGMDYLKMGYKLPNPESIRDAEKSGIIRELKTQMLHEQMKLTPSGRPTFDHPSGRNNDNVHGWELSLKGVSDYQKYLYATDITRAHVYGAKARDPQPDRGDSSSQISNKTMEKIMSRFENSSNNVKVTKVTLTDE